MWPGISIAIDFARQQERRIKKLETRNVALLKFINDEMQMTATDPRVEKLAAMLSK